MAAISSRSFTCFIANNARLHGDGLSNSLLLVSSFWVASKLAGLASLSSQITSSPRVFFVIGTMIIFDLGNGKHSIDLVIVTYRHLDKYQSFCSAKENCQRCKTLLPPIPPYGFTGSGLVQRTRKTTRGQWCAKYSSQLV